MSIYVAEFVGTAMMILLGCGAVANVSLNKSGMKGGGSVQIALGWGFALMLPMIIFGEESRTLFNPAITIALAVEKTITWDSVPLYIIAQFLGAFVGGGFVYILFKEQLDATPEADTKLKVFATVPSVENIPLNILSELIATFVLVFSLKGVENVTSLATGIDTIYLFAIVVAIGISVGGLTGFAMNPARDLGPRLVHALSPKKGKGSSEWGYTIVTIVGPIIGAILAVLLYGVMFR